MRELVLDRIEAIRAESGGFNKRTMRWQYLTHNDVPISEIKFDLLSDTMLLQVYERILRSYFKQM